MSKKRKLLDVGVIPRKITLTVPIPMGDTSFFTKFVSGASFFSNMMVGLQENHPLLHKKKFCGVVFEMPAERENHFFDLLKAYYETKGITFHKP